MVISNTGERYMEMTHRSSKYWDEIAVAIDKMILVKKRYFTKRFLRKIIVLHSIYTEEKVAKKIIEKRDERSRDYIDDLTVDYDPEKLTELAVTLYPELKGIAFATSDWITKEPINVTPDWIKNVIILYNESNIDGSLSVLGSIAENLPE